MVFPILGSGALAAGYDIDNSLRFGDGTPRLYRTTVTPTNVKKYTISAWVKSCDMDGNSMTLMTCEGGTGYILFNANEAIETYDTHPTYQISQATSAAYRDPSAWMHIVWGVDTTQTGIDNISKIYVNGVRVTSFATNATQANDGATVVNQASITQNIGTLTDGSGYPLNGYVAQYSFIDGQQLTPSSFGEADEDSGIWKPIDVSDLTYGDNGFLLEFKNSAVGTGASDTIGADTSGEDNHFTSTNIAVIDQCTDTPTNNWATFNSLHPSVGNPSNQTALVYSEGNTKVVGQTSGVAYSFAISTIAVSSGKWYYEFYRPDTDSGTVICGAQNPGLYNTHGSHDMSISNNGGVGIRGSNGELYNDGSSSSVSNGTEYKDAGDILSVKLNMDDDEISFSTNGATYTSAVSLSSNVLASGFVAPGANIGDDEELTVNFGNPNWALSSGNVDANSYGNFEYAVPSGYYALCTKNLAEYG